MNWPMCQLTSSSLMRRFLFHGKVTIVANQVLKAGNSSKQKLMGCTEQPCLFLIYCLWRIVQNECIHSRADESACPVCPLGEASEGCRA